MNQLRLHQDQMLQRKIVWVSPYAKGRFSWWSRKATKPIFGLRMEGASGGSRLDKALDNQAASRAVASCASLARCAVFFLSARKFGIFRKVPQSYLPLRRKVASYVFHFSGIIFCRLASSIQHPASNICIQHLHQLLDTHPLFKLGDKLNDPPHKSSSRESYLVEPPTPPRIGAKTKSEPCTVRVPFPGQRIAESGKVGQVQVWKATRRVSTLGLSSVREIHLPPACVQPPVP